MKENLQLPFYMKWALVLIIVVILTYVAVIAQKLIIPLCFSFLFSILLLPLCNFLENRLRFPRTLASILASVLFIFSLLFIIYLLGSQLASFSKDWPLLKSQLSGLMVNGQQWIAATFHIDATKENTFINNTSDRLLHLNSAVVGETLLSISSLLLFVVFLLIYTILILSYRRLLVLVVVATFTDKYFTLISDILTEVKQIIKGYIVGLFLEMLIVSFLAVIIFLILGIKYVVVLAVITGVFNLIPYVGIFTALFFSVCVTFATSDSKLALFVGISIFCIHLLDSNFVGPKIVGSHVKINPFLIILGVVVGEMVWGIPGMFLSIPLLAIGKVIFDKVEGLKPLGILLGEEEVIIKKK
jgi:putative permease